MKTESWNQNADTVWITDKTCAVVKTIDDKGNITRSNHKADCEYAKLIASAPALLDACHRALEILALANVPEQYKGHANEVFNVVLSATTKASL